MKEANLTLIVPSSLHKEYPKNTGMPILTLESFIATVKIEQTGQSMDTTH